MCSTIVVCRHLQHAVLQAWHAHFSKGRRQNKFLVMFVIRMMTRLTRQYFHTWLDVVLDADLSTQVVRGALESASELAHSRSLEWPISPVRDDDEADNVRGRAGHLTQDAQEGYEAEMSQLKSELHAERSMRRSKGSDQHVDDSLETISNHNDDGVNSSQDLDSSGSFTLDHTFVDVSGSFTSARRQVVSMHNAPWSAGMR